MALENLKPWPEQGLAISIGRGAPHGSEADNHDIKRSVHEPQFASFCLYFTLDYTGTEPCQKRTLAVVLFGME